MGEAPLTQADITQGLRDTGVKAGVKLMVHSSLSSFGWVDGGPLIVIKALMEVLTTRGTLLMPSFNHGAPFTPDGPGYYDPTETPTANGAIADAFWRLPNVHRSLNPTHAFASWGENAQHYVSHHHLTLTMGPQSPLGLLLADDGYALLLGVDYRVNTFHHVAEVITGAPCLGKRTETYPVRMPDGTTTLGRTWGWRNAPCPLTSQGQYGATMKQQDLERTHLIGSSRATLFRLQDCFNVVAERLGWGADGAPPCQQCPVRPRVVPHTVESDYAESTNNDI